MKLLLEIKNLDQSATQVKDKQVFTTFGGSIGRAPTNDWVLADKEKVISGKHAIISYEANVFQITDISTNGVLLNNSAVGKGNKKMLKSGDMLRIGSLDITVEVEHMPAEALEHSSKDDFFSSLANVDMSGEAIDVDIQPNDNILFASEDVSNFNEQGAEPDHLPIEEGFFQPPNSKVINTIPEGWDKASNNKESEGTVSQKPKTATKESTSVQKTLAESNCHIGGNNNSLSQFLTGLGIDSKEMVAISDEEFMLMMGKLTRELLHGLIQALMARSALKNEFRIPMTMLKPVENNPLKLSPNVDEALAFFLNKKSSGYLSPLESVSEGFSDLQDHQIAIMAGIQTAFDDLISRFDPQRIENDFSKINNSKMGGITKRFKFSEWYEDYYSQLIKDPEYTFQQLFGETFVKEYEKQLDQLQSRRKPNN